ncbi:WD40/YVTN/BNR-like repeat-containing protein [Ketobacter nezhaii]|uniref:WD40/YVTN/BNR-like repeat-containing protein n=1 Tax=Ketobacter sp. MCCC 1A13808 TaxID=2602738 RepID=UPI0018DD9760|nr:YCF48-related protein [Ketobacter sp. MCCC 1A13808]
MWTSTKKLHSMSLTAALFVVCWAGIQSKAIAADYLSQLNTRPSMKSQIATSSLLTSLDVFDSKLVAVGDNGHILISEDNGEHWEQSEVPVQLLLTAVDFPTPTQGWVVGHEGVILHSSDAGKTWQLQYAKPHVVRTDEELNQLSDEDFTKLPQEGSPLLDIWFRDDKEGFAVGAYGMFLHTEDGGKTWKDVADRIDNFDGWHLNSITSNRQGIVYIAGEKGVLFRSDDFGDSWVTLPSPYEGSFFGVLPGYGPDDVFIYGLQGNIFKSGDRGDSWQKVKSDASDGLMDGVVLGEDSVILVGNSGVVLTSQDSGESFSMQVTSSRNALLAIEKTPNGKLIMVGQGGVQLATPKTK